jgi:hypothetical protein
MPAQSPRTSAPHAERSTNNSSRGRIGRKTMTVAGAAAGAAGLAAAAPPEAGAAAEAGAEPPLAAPTACSQLGDNLALFFSRQFNAAAPPGGTPAQVF